MGGSIDRLTCCGSPFAVGSRRHRTARRVGRRLTLAVLTWLGVLAMPVSVAAPLDGFFEALPHLGTPRVGYIEGSIDRMNRTLDVFNLRPNDLADDAAGNLQGFHIRGGYGLTERLWIDGALLRRQIRYGALEPSFDSWLIGIQNKLPLPDNWHRSIDAALRVSLWGTRTDSIKASPEQLRGRSVFAFLDDLSVDRPRDRQLQMDLVGTRWLGPVAISAFAGIGRGKVQLESVTARFGSEVRRWADGQFYDEAGQVDQLAASLARQLELADELNSVNYSTRFAQAGLGLRVPLGDRWAVRAAYQWFQIRRSTDELIAERSIGQASYRLNHTLLGELSYRFAGQGRVFVRGQAMSNLFLSEMPLLYNSLTAHRFGERYGIVSVGLMLGF